METIQIDIVKIHDCQEVSITWNVFIDGICVEEFEDEFVCRDYVRKLTEQMDSQKDKYQINEITEEN